MPFSQKIRQEMMIMAARHCCVCHRYKGVRVEVHHIVPEADGGPDTIDNAIVLCFDCHADAGHYNSRQPRGTKFSPSELRIARDLWFLMVKGNRIEFLVLNEWAYTRFLLCKSFSAIAEVVSGDLKNMPVSAPRLVRTPVLEFARTLVDRNRSSQRRAEVFGPLYTSVDEYEAQHPDVKIFERSRDRFYPYFRAFRKPSLSEIQNEVIPTDPLTDVFLSLGAETDALVRAVSYDEFCGKGGFQEVYVLREIWLLLLEIRNISSGPVRLDSIVGLSETKREMSLRPFVTKQGQIAELALPTSHLAVGESAIVPVAVALSPLDVRAVSTDWSDAEDIPTGEIQAVHRAELGPIARQIDLVGPALWPQSVFGVTGDSKVEQPVHEFSFDNVYIIDRSWEAGSCPHAFFEFPEGKRYWGEIFATRANFHTREALVVPKGARALTIAELEDELTIVTRISTGRRDFGNYSLRKGESLTVPVCSADTVVVEGMYCPNEGVIGRQSPLFQNDLIRNLLASARSTPDSEFCLPHQIRGLHSEH